MIRAVSISRISRISFSGAVYNLELKSLRPMQDDSLWIEQTTGVVTHNCLDKDIPALAHQMESMKVPAPIIRAAINRNAEDRKRRLQ